MHTHWHPALKVALVVTVSLMLQFSAPAARSQSTDPFVSPVAYESADQWDATEQEQRPWLLRSPFANIGWPKIEFPRFQLLPDFSDPNQPRILGQNEPSMFETISNTPARLAARTRRAWNRSLQMLKFGGGSNQRAKRGPWLGRLFGNEPPQHEGPRTTNEWMSQDRIKL